MSTDERSLAEKAWDKFIQKLRFAGDGHCNNVQELQALCLRASYDMGDIHAQLMTARDCLKEIKASAIEGFDAAEGALECMP